VAGVRVALAVEMEVPEDSEEAGKGVEMEGEAKAAVKEAAVRVAGLEVEAMAEAREEAGKEVEMEGVAKVEVGRAVGETVAG
jgi:hypothetical protein